MAPRNRSRRICLNEVTASSLRRIWAEVSSSAPHLHSGLSYSPIKLRCLLRVLCPVRRPITALDCVLLKDRNLALASRQGPEINSRAMALGITKIPPPVYQSITSEYTSILTHSLPKSTIVDLIIRA
jgi:hypothetical protein